MGNQPGKLLTMGSQQSSAEASLNELIVSGYARIEVHKKDIPLDIVNVCIKFLIDPSLCSWRPNGDPNTIIQSDTAKFIEDDSYRGVYSNSIASTGIHEWRIKLLNVSNSNKLIVGICSTTINAASYYHGRQKDNGGIYYSYAFGSDENNVARVFTPKAGMRRVIGFRWKSGDIVAIRLDLVSATLVITRGTEVLAEINRIHTEFKLPYMYSMDYVKRGYRLAIDNYYKGNEVKLLSYCEFFSKSS